MKKKIKIIIADDHAIVREGLGSLIAAQDDMELVGEARDGQELVAITGIFAPDIILLDLSMPRMDGLAALQALERAAPEARVLVLTSFADDERVFQAIQSGALGYLLKDTPRAQLLQAIRNVAKGQAVLHPSIALKVLRELNQPAGPLEKEGLLTAREQEILRLVARGLSNQEIAAAIQITGRTAGKHVSNILRKLHLANRTQAALYALRAGLTTLDETSPGAA